ncbi:C4-dicarboxylate ABC transporter substrate-binding protein [Loktanella sp. 3ANDIMAR09]|uniref:C4-dicarboxylate TRAP transporter substrate-binding protein n=1 Tax=Loktanella sp. 3ANDIMAR09 TaxID=1225657 RepID=UPI0006F50131|nr:C4-dicarboxylate TRAP transporter substrate-binding protein [Loktanella sp. 3ANDIMAR09]KQI68832.1 C4-dicarboxylate ABC transporter substrate-binding protein [Loktanella sp. 3ANDIMAR09]
MTRTLAAAAVSLGLMATSVAAQTTLILGEAGPNRGARAVATQAFADDVTARTNGDLQIDIQWGGALFKADAALQGVSDGVADLGTIIGVYFPQEMVAYGIADLPLQNADAWVGMRATDALMRTDPSIAANLADQGLVYLGTFTTSAVNIGCKDTAIRTAEDIDGLKVRGVGAYGKVFNDLGANMVAMSIYDAYQGLDTGLLDCSQGYSYAVAALKQQEVMTSYTLMDWGQVGALGIFMNKFAYDALSPEHQQALNDAGVGMADTLGRLINADNDAAVQTMQDAGVEVITLDAAERDKLVARGAPYIDTWIEQANAAGLDGAGMLDRYRTLLAEFTAERDAQGYPWDR